MMFWTWDTSSTPDPSDIEDQQQKWEEKLDFESSAKLKFPIKAVDGILTSLDTGFEEPDVKIPRSNQNRSDVKVIKTGKKNNKKGLF
jgi:hypothetical protein